MYLDHLCGHPTFSTRIEATFRFEETEYDNGMPDRRIQQRLKAFEDAIEPFLGPHVGVIEYGAITASFHRTWFYQCDRPESFLDPLRDSGKIDVEIATEPDTQWSTYTLLRDAVLANQQE